MTRLKRAEEQILCALVRAPVKHGKKDHYNLFELHKASEGISYPGIRKYIDSLVERGLATRRTIAYRGNKMKMYNITSLGLVYAIATGKIDLEIGNVIAHNRENFLPLIFGKWDHFQSNRVAEAVWKILAQICEDIISNIPPDLIFDAKNFRKAKVKWKKKDRSKSRSLMEETEGKLREAIQSRFFDPLQVTWPPFPLYRTILTEADRRRLVEAIVKDYELLKASIEKHWKLRISLVQSALETHVYENSLLGFRADLGLPITEALPSVFEIVEAVKNVLGTLPGIKWYKGQPHQQIVIDHWSPDFVKRAIQTNKSLKS